MKFKNLTKEQLIITFDRLTRFKNTKDKYYRVFSDIIVGNLTEPVLKKSELVYINPQQLLEYAETIINESLSEYNPNVLNDKKLNALLYKYENSIFINDADSLTLLDNNINYNAFLPLINEACPINLRWLKAASKSSDLIKLRTEQGLKYPINKVLIVEGITEEILIPVFSKLEKHDFFEEGIQIIPAGGKNQVVKLYYKLIEELKLPIFLLLDKDAEDNIQQIIPKLRTIDKIHLVSCGEFEDLLPKSLIIKTINRELTNFASIDDSDFEKELSTVKNLENIFKTKGLYEFKKAEFAKLIHDNITDTNDLSEEIKSIIKELCE